MYGKSDRYEIIQQQINKWRPVTHTQKINKIYFMLYLQINKKSVNARIFMCCQSQLDFITLSSYNQSPIRMVRLL